MGGHGRGGEWARSGPLDLPLVVAPPAAVYVPFHHRCWSCVFCISLRRWVVGARGAPLPDRHDLCCWWGRGGREEGGRMAARVCLFLLFFFASRASAGARCPMTSVGVALAANGGCACPRGVGPLARDGCQAACGCVHPAGHARPGLPAFFFCFRFVRCHGPPLGPHSTAISRLRHHPPHLLTGRRSTYTRLSLPAPPSPPS